MAEEERGGLFGCGCGGGLFGGSWWIWIIIIIIVILLICPGIFGGFGFNNCKD